MPHPLACFSTCFTFPAEDDYVCCGSGTTCSEGGYSPLGAREAVETDSGALDVTPLRQHLEPGVVGDQSWKVDRNAALDDKLFVPYHEVIIREKIGSGSFKSVHRGLWHSTQVAVVRMRRGGLVVDARVMQRLSNHPNLAQFYRWTIDQYGREYVLMELLPLGPLDKLLRQCGSDFKTKAKMHICIQVCTAMVDLLKENILHRDLAARNVLVQSLDPVNVKVSDFGLARNIPSGNSKNNWSSVLQSLPVRWVPPEVIRESKWSEKSDVWAFGVTMWEIFSNGKEPYADCSNEEVITKVISGERLPMPRRCPPEVYGLMLRCWEEDPAKRPSFEEVQSYFMEWRCNRRRELEQREQHEGSQGERVLRAVCCSADTVKAVRRCQSLGNTGRDASQAATPTQEPLVATVHAKCDTA